MEGYAKSSWGRQSLSDAWSKCCIWQAPHEQPNPYVLPQYTRQPTHVPKPKTD